MKEELEHSHSHEFSPRLVNWVGWSIAAGAMALVLRKKEFLQPAQEKLRSYIYNNLIGDEVMLIAPRWTYLTAYLATLLCLTALASFYPRPWKTLPQIIIILLLVIALTPVLTMWNVYFLGSSLLFSTVVCSLGAWGTAWFIKDVPPVLPGQGESKTPAPKD